MNKLKERISKERGIPSLYSFKDHQILDFEDR